MSRELAPLLLRLPDMKTLRPVTATRRPKKIVTTLGELIAAAYDAVEGDTRRREERAARLLTEWVLAHGFRRRLLFVP